ncbi:hypothetical protein JYK14_26435 [Siccirubricoccus sp. KC 17139]|uniref:Uncharacterized protein n=1 Tax=Siccirubricoccus soli TaxID=2899147 RepID=A0ABT1DCM5_9PROT|nr:hypothetical protein [Siccirubricoccus soli]MCO6419679.1 hypothetical protein [Siccirubricoccus soli]MCP2685814.1 hypothetical protein [Siccirubricoccus soli]
MNDVLPMIQAAPVLFVLLVVACFSATSVTVIAFNRRAFKNKETEISHKNAEIALLKQQREKLEKDILIMKAEMEIKNEKINQIGSASTLNSHATPQYWPEPYSPITIIGKTFRNERVILDGYSYVRCKFTNVTFVYNGTTPVQLSNNVIQGCFVASDMAAISGAWALLKGLNFIKDTIAFEMPPGNVVSPAVMGGDPGKSTEG